MLTADKTTRPQVHSKKIDDFVTHGGRWRLIEYEAKYAPLDVSLAASDALFYNDRLPALNRVIAKRLDNMQQSYSDSDSENVSRHILNRFAENPQKIPLKRENLVKLTEFLSLHMYFFSKLMLRVKENSEK